MLFSLLKHYLELYITDNALKVLRSLYCFATSISHGVDIISPGCGVRVSLMLVSSFPRELTFQGSTVYRYSVSFVMCKSGLVFQENFEIFFCEDLVILVVSGLCERLYTR